MPRIFACAGSWLLERSAASQAVIPDGKGDSAAADAGTRIHAALEDSDTSDLKYSEEEQVKIIRQREQEITEQWAIDLSIPLEEIKIIREKRFWFDGGAFSAQIDTFIYWDEYCLVIDAKSGRLKVPPPVQNWQLRACAAAAISELGCFKHARVAIANVWGKLMPPCDYDSTDLNRIAVMLREKLKEIEQPGLPLTVGDHCRYCTAIHACPAQREQMQVAIQQRTLNWDLVKPEQKKPLWLAADMAEKAAKSIKEQIKADISSGVECPGLSKKPDGTARKITDTVSAFQVLDGIDSIEDRAVFLRRFLEVSSISIENFTTLYRDMTGKNKDDAEKFLAKCDFITTSPRSGQVVVENEKTITK